MQPSSHMIDYRLLQEHLSDETSFDEGLLVNTNRPPSPSSVSTSFLPQIQKLPTSVNRILEATKAVFDTPLSNIPDKIVYEGSLTTLTSFMTPTPFHLARNLTQKVSLLQKFIYPDIRAIIVK